MADAIRTLIGGLQGTWDTAATSSRKLLPVQTLDHDPSKRNREDVEEYFGTAVRLTKNVQGSEYDVIKFRTYLYATINGDLWASLLGMPTTTVLTTTTGSANKHVFVEGTVEGTSAGQIPYFTFQFDNGIEYWQATNAVAESAKITCPLEKMPYVDWEFMSAPATHIGTPSVPSSTSASYEPLGWPTLLYRLGSGGVAYIQVLTPGTGYTNGSQPIIFTGGGGTGAAATATVASGGVVSVSVTTPGTGYTSAPSVSVATGSGFTANVVLGGVATDMMNGSLTIKRNRKPRFPGRRNVAPKRFTIGKCEVSGDVTPDYTSDTNSIFASWRSAASPGSIEFDMMDVNTFLGGPDTTHGVNPRYSLLVPNPYVEDVKHQLMNVPVETPATFKGAYSSSTSSGVKVTLVNGLASYITS